MNRIKRFFFFSLSLSLLILLYPLFYLLMNFLSSRTKQKRKNKHHPTVCIDQIVLCGFWLLENTYPHTVIIIIIIIESRVLFSFKQIYRIVFEKFSCVTWFFFTSILIGTDVYMNEHTHTHA